jgi:hypothetical protein
MLSLRFGDSLTSRESTGNARAARRSRDVRSAAAASATNTPSESAASARAGGGEPSSVHSAPSWARSAAAARDGDAAARYAAT